MFEQVRTFGKISMVAAFLALAACATAPEQQFQDPYEEWNRKAFAFNDELDKIIIRPVTEVYVNLTPAPVEQGISNGFSNLSEPTVAASQILQGKIGEGSDSIVRFLLNSTLGIAGLFDVATPMGLPGQEEDFGQTFAAWGFGSGPYLVMPGLGTFTMRDALGRTAAIPANPSFYLEDFEARLGLGALSAVDRSAQFLEQRDLIKGDRYLFVRDAYMQRRQFLISDGATTETDPFLDE